MVSEEMKYDREAFDKLSKAEENADLPWADEGDADALEKTRNLMLERAQEEAERERATEPARQAKIIEIAENLAKVFEEKAENKANPEGEQVPQVFSPERLGDLAPYADNLNAALALSAKLSAEAEQFKAAKGEHLSGDDYKKYSDLRNAASAAKDAILTGQSEATGMIFKSPEPTGNEKADKLNARLLRDEYRFIAGSNPQLVAEAIARNAGKLVDLNPDLFKQPGFFEALAANEGARSNELIGELLGEWNATGKAEKSVEKWEIGRDWQSNIEEYEDAKRRLREVNMDDK